MERGTVVEFAVKGSPRLAVVDGPEGKNSVRVTDTFGNALVVAERDLDFSTASYRLTERSPVSASLLASWRQRAEAARAEVDLEAVWDLVHGDAPASLEALGDVLWSGLTGERAHALFRALKEDRLYFKAKGSLFEARPAAQVEELRKQQAALAQKEALQARLAERLKARVADPRVSLEAEDLRRLEGLKRWVLDPDEAADKNAALEVLRLLDRPQTEAAAFALLVEAGLWHRHENLEALRAGLNAAFPAEVAAEAEALSRLGTPAQGLADLTALASVTIDDETTTEVDDGLAVETLADGTVRYWVHIADPGRWVTPGSRLDLEARRRGTTVYLPTGRTTMFPETLAEGLFSLNPGAPVPALSFGCTLASDGALATVKVLPSLIRVERRLSYAQALALEAAGDPLLVALAESARRREQWRRAQGAVTIRLPETQIKVDLAADEVSIGIYQSEAARDWVAEFMVLAGEAAARFAQERAVPMLYRVQKAGEAVDVSHLPEGPAREFAKIVAMTRSGLASEPGPHAGLGLSAYVQATSPIRRYGDLAVHRQLKAAAAGEEPPLGPDDLAVLAAELDPLNARAAKLERSADRYWVTEYLARRKGQAWPALFLGWYRQDERLGQVLLEPLGARVTMKLSHDRPLGSSFTVNVAAADARRDILTLVEA